SCGPNHIPTAAMIPFALLGPECAVGCINCSIGCTSPQASSRIVVYFFRQEPACSPPNRARTRPSTNCPPLPAAVLEPFRGRFRNSTPRSQPIRTLPPPLPAARRPFALKIIRGAFADEQAVRMFQREAQVLGRLRHPGIAAIYESGRTPDGQHYFAMELVRGRRLDEYVRGLPQ